GTFSFGPNGNVRFWSLSDTLRINGKAYMLVNTIATLASDIAANPGGFYALAEPYNAKPDGTYGGPPIPTFFTGIFEGLGNRISNLNISPSNSNVDQVGLFAVVNTGTVENIALSNVDIQGFTSTGGLAGEARSGSRFFGVRVSGLIRCTSTGGEAGGLIGEDHGYMSHSFSTATVSGDYACLLGGVTGGLIDGIIDTSYATGSISGDSKTMVGGLAGFVESSLIDRSYATGNVSGADGAQVGGFVGQLFVNGFTGRLLTNDYATGAVSGGANAEIGGFIGLQKNAPLSSCYSTGVVTGASGSVVGGFIGSAAAAGINSHSYWNTTTSGITNRGQGAGNIANDPGIRGRTTVQLQSGLPVGFNSSIWGQSPSINSGLPYLLAIPPG
ncbi:MAG TPA: hypothetical protein VK779_01310, partial [Rhizomicrobium sp.]|nr:hypothetical protein [Rhizomicrobium sp.]